MLNIGIVFGGVTVEHEVSVISAQQVIAALDRSKYNPVPVYIAKNGNWYTGDHLNSIEVFADLKKATQNAIGVTPARGGYSKVQLIEINPKGWFAKPKVFDIDVFFLAQHGAEGENGGLQGLFQSLNVPYTGSTILGSAVGMDKVVSKMLARDQGIPVIDFAWFRESDWANKEEVWLDKIEKQLGYPVVVKPAGLGSSIGIALASNRQELDSAIEEAFRYDPKVIVEHAVQALREINCAVLGDSDIALASVLEEPLAGEDLLLSFEDKYQRGSSSGSDKSGKFGGNANYHSGKTPQNQDEGMASLDRKIPADLPETETRKIQVMGVKLFRLFECAGVARIDFMIDKTTGNIYFNEINTVPGSFAFYLWEPSGIDFTELTDKMIQTALSQHQRQSRRIKTYDTNLLSERSSGGLKAAKG